MVVNHTHIIVANCVVASTAAEQVPVLPIDWAFVHFSNTPVPLKRVHRHRPVVFPMCWPLLVRAEAAGTSLSNAKLRGRLERHTEDAQSKCSRVWAYVARRTVPAAGLFRLQSSI